MPERHDQTGAAEPGSVRPELARRCRRITEARWFALTVFAVILLNAALLGMETSSGVVEEWHLWLRLAEHGCLAPAAADVEHGGRSGRAGLGGEPSDHPCRPVLGKRSVEGEPGEPRRAGGVIHEPEQ